MTTKVNPWLLPDGVDELLPPQANQLETLRREILDLYRGWGYDLIKTPLIEFLDSLLIVPSHELQLSTCKIVDQLSGKSMGVRADISSQAARIDAHVLQKQGPVRLCYADSVLKARPAGPLGTRSPQLIGAEFYGHDGIGSDLEIIGLMLQTLEIAGIQSPLLALGHSKICRTLLERAGLSGELQEKLFAALQNKASSDIRQCLASAGLDARLTDCLAQLPNLHGDAGILDSAGELLRDTDPAIDAALEQLRDIADAIGRRFPGQRLYFDLCELGGYDYHNGVIFSACVAGHGEAIAKGGRYDSIGEIFGRARAATGFDADLKTLLRLGKREFAAQDRIYAPATGDAALAVMVGELRSAGESVVQGFNSDDPEAEAQELGCTRQLAARDGQWQVVTLD